jgi:hypothetical protein
MESLRKLLAAHFDASKREEILYNLRQLQLTGFLDTASRLLYRKDNQLGDIITILSALLLEIAHKLEPIKRLGAGRKKVNSISIFMFIFLGDFLNRTLHEPQQILGRLRKNLLLYKDLFGHRHDPFTALIDFERLALICSARKSNGGISFVSSGELAARFIWTNKGKLEELVHQLLIRKLISRKSDLFDLFLRPRKELTIQWDGRRMHELSLLLFRLYSMGFLKISGNKGYFALAERHFRGINGTIIKKNSLKKLSSHIRAEYSRYSNVISEVDAIIRSISASD